MSICNHMVEEIAACTTKQFYVSHAWNLCLSDWLCWMAESFKTLLLDGLWMYSVTVSRAITIRGYRNKTRFRPRPLYTWHTRQMHSLVPPSQKRFKVQCDLLDCFLKTKKLTAPSAGQQRAAPLSSLPSWRCPQLLLHWYPCGGSQSAVQSEWQLVDHRDDICRRYTLFH